MSENTFVSSRALFSDLSSHEDSLHGFAFITHDRWTCYNLGKGDLDTHSTPKILTTEGGAQKGTGGNKERITFSSEVNAKNVR